MHNAPNSKKSVNVRVPSDSWKDLSKMAQEDKRNKTQQFETIVDEEKNRRQHLKGERKKK